jgi:hypothetical protein
MPIPNLPETISGAGATDPVVAREYYNASGADIALGEPVEYDVAGPAPNVPPAIITAGAASKIAVGIALEVIPDGSSGLVCIGGLCDALGVAATTIGDLLETNGAGALVATPATFDTLIAIAVETTGAGGLVKVKVVNGG